MTSQTLYIIGNGFDLHHGLPTQYWRFKDYLEKVDREVYDWVDSYIAIDEDWAELELSLADLDIANIVSDLEGFLASYSDENWSDSGHHDFQFEVERVATGLSGGLQQHFADWIRSIAMPEHNQVPRLLTSLDRDAAYLTFNYTSTLTKLYGIASDNTLHIHGEGQDENSELVLGHAWAAEVRPSLQRGLDEDADTRFMEAMGILDDYFEKTFKPSAKIIEQQKPYFAGLKSITQVVVLGHSLSKVDEAYFLALVDALQASPRWTVAVRSHDEDATKAACLAGFGIPTQSIGFKLWSEL
ncbi:bacteriophage abortive infection AbiH family protein [Pseudomonas protegens]|uniref:bacteriophage abortive infection AbiH family protein n=1 Tax=Pseudomonas protegens TaxID=380021 RepID=UPI00227E0307|nr:bacteriophage abortive infection AbiH family protein [Pseudomonas protegens]MCY7261899.1 bacteriophage abortive infection AbiH family protein [Pseudomonas protegens]